MPRCADEGGFEALVKIDVPGGALVEFTLTRLTAFCGRRRPASLLAEMAAAEQAQDAQQ